jgi:two-component system, NarL family, response regulator DevR
MPPEGHAYRRYRDSAYPPSMAIRILLCDDHDMVRDALGRVLSEEADFEIVASARSVDACLKHLAQNEGKIDVAVIDVRLTDGVGHDITRWIRAHQSPIRVVLLTSFLEDELLVEGYSTGADALILKGAPTRDLTEAIRDVHAGLRLIDAAAARAASHRLQQSNPTRVSVLEGTEKEIAELISKGMTDKEIAAAMNFSTQTIKNHVSRILTVVGAANRTQLAVMVATANLPDPQQTKNQS